MVLMGQWRWNMLETFGEEHGIFSLREEELDRGRIVGAMKSDGMQRDESFLPPL